ARPSVRGPRPSWRATPARSASVTTGGSMTRRMLPAPPLRNVLDDEVVLAGPDVTERPRLGGEGGIGRGVLELLLERGLLLLQLSHRRELGRTLRARIEVVVQRPVVEEADEHERTYREPATGNPSSEAPAALLPRGHPVRARRRKPRRGGHS